MLRTELIKFFYRHFKKLPTLDCEKTEKLTAQIENWIIERFTWIHTWFKIQNCPWKLYSHSSANNVRNVCNLTWLTTHPKYVFYVMSFLHRVFYASQNI